MRRKDILALEISLGKAMQAWWEDEPLDSIERPYIGDETIAIMARAAINVLLGVEDVYETLARNDELKEAE